MTEHLNVEERGAESSCVDRASGFGLLAWYIQDAADGLGERFLVFDDTTDDALEVLRLRPELSGVLSFEPALRERAESLADFQHPSYGRIRRVDRLAGPGGGLAIVSEQTPGVRLADILRVAEKQRLSIEIDVAFSVIRRILPAIISLHHQTTEATHGALGPERVVVTPDARIVIVEYVLGSALERAQWSRDHLWKELRIAVPAAAGPARFDRRTDVTQIGILALSLLLGRLLRADEYPHRLPDLLASVSEVPAEVGRGPLPPALRAWLAQMLQIDLRRSFHSAVDALHALEELQPAPGDDAQSAGLASLLAHYHESAERPVRRPASVEGEPMVGPNFALAGPDRVSLMDGAEFVDLESPAAREADKATEHPIAALLAQENGGSSGGDGGDVGHSEGFAERSSPVWSTVSAVPAEAEPQPASGGDRWPVAGLSDAGPPGDPDLAASRVRLRIRAPMPQRLRQLAVVGLALVAFGEAAFIAMRLYVTRSTSPPTVAPPTVEARLASLEGTGPWQASGAVPVALDGPGEVAPEQSRTNPAGDPGALDKTRQKRGPAGAITPATIPPPPTKAKLSETAASGWVAVSVPIDALIFEAGRLVGTSRGGRIALSAGRHELEIVSEPLAYRSTHVVVVPPGQVAPLRITLPQGILHINAQPWAEVWIDGERVGDTPLGNVPTPIGPHEIVFRHPEFGEQRRSIVVTLDGPQRLSVDLRR